MHIYFSGIGGVAIGPLAMLAKAAGYTVVGSDMGKSLTTERLDKADITYHIGQSGAEIAAEHAKQPIDWVVYSSAVPENSPELTFAREHGIRTSKRSELINQIMQEKNLKMIAIAGTHGKTTTTGMVVWLCKQLGKPVGYSIGTNISFGQAGDYEAGSEYFVYEADEFDRNFLQYKPHLSLITTVGYDHADIYPTPENYDDAFKQFISQSESTILWQADADKLEITPAQNLSVLPPTANNEAETLVTLPGRLTRADAWLAVQAICKLYPEIPVEIVVNTINHFPGTERRFEQISPGLYSDYAHMPAEIRAVVELASELSKDIVVVYQGLHNTRQHQIIDQYQDCFSLARKVYWVPSYLAREDPSLPLLTPAELATHLSDPSIVEPAEMNDELMVKIQKELANGALVLAIAGGSSLDHWIRDKFAKN